MMDTAVGSDFFGEAAFLFGSLGEEALGMDEVFVEIVLRVGQGGSPTLLRRMTSTSRKDTKKLCSFRSSSLCSEIKELK